MPLSKMQMLYRVYRVYRRIFHQIAEFGGLWPVFVPIFRLE